MGDVQAHNSSTLQASRIPTGQLQHPALLQAFENRFSSLTPLALTLLNQSSEREMEKRPMYGSDRDRAYSLRQGATCQVRRGGEKDSNVKSIMEEGHN
jgi:hypothetical protein